MLPAKTRVKPATEGGKGVMFGKDMAALRVGSAPSSSAGTGEPPQEVQEPRSDGAIGPIGALSGGVGGPWGIL